MPENLAIRIKINLISSNSYNVVYTVLTNKNVIYHLEKWNETEQMYFEPTRHFTESNKRKFHFKNINQLAQFYMGGLVRSSNVFQNLPKLKVSLFS